jgi:hypothetical protein
MLSPPLCPPSLLKVREAVEHGRRQGGELVAAQTEFPAGRTEGEGLEHARQRGCAWQHRDMRVTHCARACAPSGMQRGLARVLA